MLNVTAQKSAEGAKTYFAKSDYYSEGQEIIGNWGGRGAVLLGLHGEVDKPHFDRLCDNINPKTELPLTKITRTGRRVGYDFTWSAPKSVSVAHAMLGDERIMQAFRDSIRETMSEMEEDMATRVRKGGESHDRPSQNWVYAEFVHLTSRPINGIPCPQLHSHNFVFNATLDPVENEFKAGQFGTIKGDGYYWQAVQQARFATKLQELGYQTRRTKDAFEITGVPESAIKKFSLRTTIIERMAAALGIKNPKSKAKLGATTRERKNDSIPYSDLVELWNKRLDPVEREALVELPKHEGKVAIDNRAHAQYAAEHIFERSSVVDERRLLTLALRHGCGEVTPEGVRNEMNRLGLLKRVENDKTLVTTKRVLEEESRMISFAVAGKGTMRPISQGKPDEESTLSEEQQAVIKHLLTSQDRILLVRGAAGTGKTTLSREAVARIEAAGKHVTMLAPTTPAVEVLQKDGFAANTLQKFLVDGQLQRAAANGVVWVDEAGLISSKSGASLFELADRLNSRVVLMGDSRQLSPVERGSAFRVLEDIAKLPVAEVTEIRRQKPEDYREAVRLLSDGETAAGLDKLDQMGRVQTMPVWDAYAPVAKEYVQAIRRGESALIVCPTHIEGERVAEEVRKQLKIEGRLGNEDRIFERLVPTQWTEAELRDAANYTGHEELQFFRNSGPYKAGQRIGAGAILGKELPSGFAAFRKSPIRLSRGEIIRITAPCKSMEGNRLTNGSTYTVKGFDKKGNIELSNGWTLKEDVGHFTHAYSNTAFAAQGRTVDRVMIVSSAQSAPAMNKEAFYVAASRGRKSATVWTDSKSDLREAVQRSSRKMSATELAKKAKPQLWRRMRQALGRIQRNAIIAAKRAAHDISESLRQKELRYAIER